MTVLTTSAFGGFTNDREDSVLRAGDLGGSPLLRRLLRRPPADGSAASATAPAAAPAPAALESVVVPDAYLVSWCPAAYVAARALLSREQFDCIVTSSPTESTHVLGIALRRLALGWVADFRDGWAFEPSRRPFPTRGQRELHRALERRVVRSADVITAVSRPIVDDMSRRLGTAATWIPNGWDPAVAGDLPARNAEPIERGRFTIVHTGRLTGPWGRDPRPLLDAVARLRSDRPEMVDRLRIVLAGNLDTTERELIDTPALRGLVRHVGYLPRRDALALQRRADALLLVTSGHHSSEATSKLFEYLAAGRPIIALAARNEAARILAETGGGRCADPDDPSAVDAVLRLALDGGLPAPPPGAADRYAYPYLAEAMEQAVEAAMAARARTVPRRDPVVPEGVA